MTQEHLHAILLEFISRQSQGVYVIRERDRSICYADALVTEIYGKDLLGQPCY